MRVNTICKIYAVITVILLTCSVVVNAAENVTARQALDLRDGMELENVASNIASARVVYIGETHDSYSDHITQLEIIRLLHTKNSKIAIGMEQFQQPFQSVLDGYTRGEIDEKELIRQSEWIERWRFDYRLYRPILSFAREHGIPVIALNIPKEITAKVSKEGIEGLAKEDKDKIPSDIDYSDDAYKERLKQVFANHPHKNEEGFERFMQVQLLWDEGMAAKAADYLQTNPNRQLVVLAGIGHVMYGSGIPQRVSRRVQAESAIILPAGEFPLDQNVADFLVQGGGELLPERGMLGIFMLDSEEGIKVKELVPEGSAIEAGVEEGDLILQVNGQRVRDVADLKLILMDEPPGNLVTLHILRKNLLLKDKEIDLEFELGK
jgi:uncharacterized iron-regulated protein